jgi:hypothetical protein
MVDKGAHLITEERRQWQKRLEQGAASGMPEAKSAVGGGRH